MLSTSKVVRMQVWQRHGLVGRCLGSVQAGLGPAVCAWAAGVLGEFLNMLNVMHHSMRSSYTLVVEATHAA